LENGRNIPKRRKSKKSLIINAHRLSVSRKFIGKRGNDLSHPAQSRAVIMMQYHSPHLGLILEGIALLTVTVSTVKPVLVLSDIHYYRR
jgi:hypothetical protein